MQSKRAGAVITAFLLAGLISSCNSVAFTHAVSYYAGIGGNIYDADPNTGQPLSTSKYYLQSVVEGFDSMPVIAVARTGYYFVKWDDGLTNPFRYEKCVLSDYIFTAIFKEIS